MTRTPLLLPLIFLSACNSSTDPVAGEQAMMAGNDKIECALAGSEDFARACSTDRISGADREILIIQHPDGGFQRFEIVTDGRGLIAADGFDDTEIRLLDDGMIEVTSDDNRYRLPARIQSADAAKSPPAP